MISKWSLISLSPHPSLVVQVDVLHGERESTADNVRNLQNSQFAIRGEIENNQFVIDNYSNYSNLTWFSMTSGRRVPSDGALGPTASWKWSKIKGQSWRRRKSDYHLKRQHWGRLLLSRLQWNLIIQQKIDRNWARTMGAVCASITVDRLWASREGEMRRNEEGRERSDCSLIIPHFLLVTLHWNGNWVRFQIAF